MAVTAFIAVPALAAPAPGVTFTKIADTSTLIPAGQWAGERFASFGVPGIDQGDVVFAGVRSNASGQNGIYKWRSGVLGLVADPSTANPYGGTLSEFVEPVVDRGEFAFRTEANGSGVFRTAGGAVIAIGTMPVTRFRSPSLDAADVWFYGYSFGQGPLGGVIDAGFYRARSGVIENLVPDGSPTPGAPPGNHLQLANDDHRVVARDGTATFWASSASPTGGQTISGLYVWKDGAIREIVDSTTPPPGAAGGSFNTFVGAAFDSDGRTVVFRNNTSVYSTANGFYVARGDGSIEPLALVGQAAPGGGQFSFRAFTDVSVDAGRVAFSEGSNPIGMPFNIFFGQLGGPLQRLIGRDDVLFDEVVSEVRIGSQALNGAQIVFHARFASGAEGLYVATLPEPSVLFYWTAALLVGAARGSRRHNFN